MGMSASQLRLLSITARMHDVELKAQRIQSEKLALATQEDAAYEKYCNALDATKIQVAQNGGFFSGDTYIDACYDNTCGFNPNNQCQYSLINNKNGYVIVPENVKNTYDWYYNDKYAFALAMLGMDEETLEDSLEGILFVGIGTDGEDYLDDPEYDPPIAYEDEDGVYSLVMMPVEYDIYIANADDDNILRSKFEDLQEAMDPESDASDSEKQKLLMEFRNYLYAEYGDEIFEHALYDEDGEPYNDDFADMYWGDIAEEFNYYASLFDQIQEAGGCETIAPEVRNGENGVEWFNNMVKSGQVTIMMLNRGNDKGWVETSIATSVGNNYLREVQDDKMVKKAEAEYEHEQKIINSKDSKYDTELKNLETEESALNAQIDGLKQIIKENSDRTMNTTS